MGPIKLTQEWKQFTIDLTGKDLRHIVGGFMFLLRRSENPMGAVFYFDEIVYRGDPKDDLPGPRHPAWNGGHRDPLHRSERFSSSGQPG